MTNEKKLFIALLGCGFVADYYMATLKKYPWLQVAGVFDIDPERLASFTSYYGLRRYADVEQLLGDPQVSIVLNLTNPRAHYALSKLCIAAGKHVYSEKPLAMEFEQAEELVSLAEANNVTVLSAPCSLLGNAAQTLWHGVHHEVVGKVRAVYAELDEGMVHKMAYEKWKSASGAQWPYKDEFEVGCTLEHAGYYVGWLVAMFGNVKSIHAFADCRIPEKLTGEVLAPPNTPDFSVGLLRFESGVVARLTTTIVGPRNHSIQVICDDGLIEMKDCWFNDANVYVRRHLTIRRKTLLSPIKTKYRVRGLTRSKLADTGGNRMDFAAGVAELASSVLEHRRPRLSQRFSLHVNEVVLALQQGDGIYMMKSRCEKVNPLW